MVNFLTNQFVCTHCGSCSPKGNGYCEMCDKALEAGWITVARKFCGQVWLEHFCPECHVAADECYEQQVRDHANGLTELSSEIDGRE
jgi:hypothetical protein